MEWYVIVILVLLIPIILFPVAYVWYLNIGGTYAAIREARARRAARAHEEGKTRASAIVGRRVRPSIPAIGRPMRIVLRVAMPVGIYGFLIWFFLVGFGWGVALALGLAMPVMLIPVAFVWYLNVSGLYRVIRDARQRERRRAKALREAQLMRGKPIVGTAGSVKTEGQLTEAPALGDRRHL